MFSQHKLPGNNMKKPVKIILLICAAFLSTMLPLSAETETVKPKDDTRHALGLAAGLTTGSGLSYRYWPGDFGFQATFLPNTAAGEPYVNSGITFFYQISRTQTTRFYLYASSRHLFKKYDEDYYDYGSDWYTERNGDSYEYSLSIGAGPGIEIFLFEDIGINLMTGYAVHNINRDTVFTMTVESAVFYNF